MAKRKIKAPTVPLEDRCQVAYCPNEYGYIYLKKRVCEWCWMEYAEDREGLYEALKVAKSLRCEKLEVKHEE